jgi:hypothetical protein
MSLVLADFAAASSSFCCLLLFAAHFLASGYRSDSLFECHGNVEWWQCSAKCAASAGAWPLPRDVRFKARHTHFTTCLSPIKHLSFGALLCCSL